VIKLKIIHTGDLHLGVKFKNVVPRGEIEGFKPINIKNFVNIRTIENFKRAVEYGVKHNIDIFIVSGDIFETIESSLEYHVDFIRSIQPLLDNEIKTIVIGGNHDYIRSARRRVSLALFEEYKSRDLIFKSKVDIAGGFDRDSPYYIKLDDNNVGVILLPYFWVQKSEYPNAVKLYIKKMLRKLNNVDYKILVAHIDVTGAKYRDEDFIGSFRTIEKVPLTYLYPEKFDYIALGHIHIPQMVSYENVWYSGSLNRLNFGEYRDRKGFLYIEVKDRLKVDIIDVDPVKMHVYMIDLDDIEHTWSNISKRIENILEKNDNLDSILKVVIKVRTLNDYRNILNNHGDKIMRLIWRYGAAGIYLKPYITGVSEVSKRYIEEFISGEELLKSSLKDYLMSLPYDKEFKDELYKRALRYLGADNE